MKNSKSLQKIKTLQIYPHLDEDLNSPLTLHNALQWSDLNHFCVIENFPRQHPQELNSRSKPTAHSPTAQHPLYEITVN